MRISHSARWALLALLVFLIPAASRAGVFISVNFGPPVLPVYVQPVCPAPDLLWTPGYWAYGDDGYFWVPGAWVPAPYANALWTPGYWGWSTGLYIFHPGYWGYHVGYYGGVNYGFGYMGMGFVGGEWRGGHMAYNTAVINVNTTVIHNTYVNQTIVQQNTIVNNNHVAYAGGPGGIQHQPTPEERIAENETHTAPTSFQNQHIQAAQSNKQSYAKVNGGRPATLAVARPLAVESHPAPPVSHTAMTNGGNAARIGGNPGSVRNVPASDYRPNNTANTGVRNTTVQPNARPTYTPPKNNTYAPPKNNSEPPKSSPKPPSKPKPEGHEK